MENNEQRHEGQLADALNKYTNALPNKINDLDALWHKLLQEWDQWVFEDFKRSTHSLHGSGSLYGYTEMSAIAGKIEQILNKLTDSKTISVEDKDQISGLLQELKQSSSKPTIKSADEANREIKNKSNTIYIASFGYQVDNSNRIWANEMIEQLKIFNYEARFYASIEELEVAFKDSQPLSLLLNFSMLDSVDKDKFTEFRKKYMAQTTLIYFAMTGDFNSRLKAVQTGGQAYLIRPFTIDELIYELERVIRIKNESYRILIIDDDTDSSDYFSLMLKQAGMHVLAIQYAHDVDIALREFKPDLILSDIYMPECSGNELAMIIRQQRTCEFIPIIYLSVEENAIKQAEAISSGADDFISKKTEPDYLIRVVRNKAYRYKLLKSITTKDNLTVADNLGTVNHQLEVDLKRCIHAGQSMTVAIIEVSNMAKINSIYGYNAGDQVLKSLALMLRNYIRFTDTVGRFSENKFIVLFPDRDLNATKTFIVDLQKRFLSLNYYYNNQIFNAQFTAGLASSSEYLDASSLSAAADKALVSNPV